MPEFLIAAITSTILGWGAITWKKSEQANEVAEKALHRVDGVELKVAEGYITKRDFEQSMDRLFDSLSEMKSDVKYLSNKMDYHVDDQAAEMQKLRSQLRKRWF